MLAKTPEEKRFAHLSNKLDELFVAVDTVKELVKELRPKPAAKPVAKASEPSGAAHF